MFFDRSNGFEQPNEVDCATSASQRVQPLRLTPIQGGAWCLPSLHPDIPTVLRAAETGLAEKAFAGFALQAHADGVRLPGGRFTTISHAINKQWRALINSSLKDHNSPLNMSMQLHGTDEKITVSIGVPGTLEILRMKALVEALNAAADGLGWWVAELANSAARDYYPIYTLEKTADNFCSNEGTSLTDADLVETINDREGRDEDDQMNDQELAEAYCGMWPSDLIDAVDGHSWLFHQQRWDKKTGQHQLIGEKPFIASDADANEFLKRSGGEPHLKAAVQAFAELSIELGRTDSKLKNGSRGEAYEDEYVEAIGASCALVWDDSTLLMQCVSHWEVDLQNCGEYTDEHITFSADSMSDEDIGTLIQSIKDFVERHRAISKAFSFFEVQK